MHPGSSSRQKTAKHPTTDRSEIRNQHPSDFLTQSFSRLRYTLATPRFSPQWHSSQVTACSYLFKLPETVRLHRRASIGLLAREICTDRRRTDQIRQEGRGTAPFNLPSYPWGKKQNVNDEFRQWRKFPLPYFFYDI